MTNDHSDARKHWEGVYRSRAGHEVSWFQSEPARSLEFIGRAGLSAEDPIIDVGGGASALAGRLWRKGYRDITVLDISTASLAGSRSDLENAPEIQYVEADVRRFRTERRFALWHDRALFHFMTTASDRQEYIASLRHALRRDGELVLAAFAVGGPRRCSGLEIIQYDAERLSRELGRGFKLEEQAMEIHLTPAGKHQKFGWYRYRRTR